MSPVFSKALASECLLSHADTSIANSPPLRNRIHKEGAEHSAFRPLFIRSAPRRKHPCLPRRSLSQLHKISAFANFYLPGRAGSAMIDAKNAKKGGTAMGISYNNLFKLLIDRGWSKTEFARKVGISSNTLAKLSKNEPVSLEVLVRRPRRKNPRAPCRWATWCRSCRWPLWRSCAPLRRRGYTDHEPDQRKRRHVHGKAVHVHRG